MTTSTASFAGVEPLPAQNTPVIAVTTNAEKNSLTFLSWDSEGGNRARTNLLGEGKCVHLEAQRDGEWSTLDDAYFAVTPQDGGFDLTVRATTALAQATRLVFPFAPCASATTVIPSSYGPGGDFLLPAVISSPLCGLMVVRGPADLHIASTLSGSRAEQFVDWKIDLPADSVTQGITLSFRALQLDPPADLYDMDRWQQVRRAWCNVWQVSADWGDQSKPFSAPAGVLANSVISDPVSACLHVYADAALLTPQLAPDVSILPTLARTIDWFLEERTLESGQVISYYDHKTFLDSNPSLLIAAWDLAEAARDDVWLSARIEKLERAADYLAARDIDNDGIVEAVLSGNAGTLHEPVRPSNAYDCINFGHKDAYSNILIYRAWRCMADLEKRLGHEVEAAKYSALADKLHAAYFDTFYDTHNERLIGWISADGARHDYAFTFLNFAAIDYGLVPPDSARRILAKLMAKMKAAGFTRFDTGMPWSLIPVRREDYLHGIEGFGVPQQEDGADTFGRYCNGGVYPGDGQRLLAAHYALDDNERGDELLDAMLARVAKGDIQDGGFACSVVDKYPHGGEFFDWNGQTCGYEGMLSHCWYFTQAVALREPALRERLYRPLMLLNPDSCAV